MTRLRTSFKGGCYSWLVLGAANAIAATPTLQGQSGYINMPSAVVEADGTFSAGYGYDKPYGSLWATATVLPFLQFTGRYVAISGIQGFSGGYGKDYGRYKDKVADAKLRLWSESDWLPAVAVGATDLLGTELFKGKYIVATKTFGPAHNIEASLGFGRGRPEGPFAGVRWSPQSLPGWSVVAEYDANDYKRDFRANLTSASSREKGPALGVEYRWGWLGAQVARHRNHFSANAYVSIPFSEREFIPKLFEPPYYQPKNAPVRATLAQWQDQPKHSAALIDALARQGFKNIRIEVDGTTFKLSLTSKRISNLGRAVGRASRTALAFAPTGTRAIKVTYTKLEQPVATFEFLDLPTMSDYLTGMVGREAFLQTTVVRYATPADRILIDENQMLLAVGEQGGLNVQVGHEGEMVSAQSEDRETNRFKVVPKASFFFNDPSGALRYEIWAAANYDRRLAEGTYLNAALKLNLFENVSGVTQTSNSLLPHVRSDVAEYKRGSRLKLNRMLVNHYALPAERVYARFSAGLYEEMYRGLGGQVLYLPRDSRWAADFAVDALEQRGFKGWFDKRDYRTVTTLGTMHYRLPYDMTVSARAGRFLAGDKGARFEFKRRFRSGIEIGAWYTRTNGRDTTGPGTPAEPYYDKGVFLSIPINSMLPSDTQAVAGVAISPWTRDVGQMVATPGDLYEMLEDPRRDLTAYDGLGNFAERRDEQKLDVITQPVRPLPSAWPAFRWRLEQSVSNSPTLPQWAGGALLGGGAILAGAALDKPVDRIIRKHADSRAANAYGNVGKAMPWLLAGAAGSAIAFGDDRMQNMGIISLQSIAGAAGVSMATKRLVGRARPYEERGAFSSSGKRSDASFPSNHAAVAFAAVTPFAQEYDAPWLYGLAAVGAMGRVADRQHWVSDVVGGGLVGYAIGSWLWQAQREDPRSRLAITPGRKELSVTWSTTY
nr:YjbH domain-containing protein [Massilia sp. ZL223]